MSFVEPDYKYSSSVGLIDNSGQVFATLFDKQMKSLIGISAVDLKKLQDEGDKNTIKSIYKKVYGKYYTMAVVVKNDEWQGEIRAKMTVVGEPTSIDTPNAIKD